MMTIKKINQFKSIIKPTKLEINIGLAYMLFFSNID
jgi:hypothetical protein